MGDNSRSAFPQIIVIIKHILENKLGRKDCFQMSGIDAMILSFVRSVSILVAMLLIFCNETRTFDFNLFGTS